MAVLDHSKHEIVAQALAKGLCADKAYAAAGYKPHRGNAARMSSNESIKARVAELQQKQVQKVHEYTAINVREQMHKLMGIIDDAREAGDIANALKGQMFVMEMFGFNDLPTLTHEMLGDRGMQTTTVAPPTEERQAEVAKKNILQFGRVHQELIRLAGPRTIEHEPKK
jgi:hypothetical protein